MQSEERLLAIAARSSEGALAFGNDADDMRSPGTGMDPRVNIYDLSFRFDRSRRIADGADADHVK
jgi:hypothetical protein